MEDGYPPTWDRDAIKKWQEVHGVGSRPLELEETAYAEFASSPAWPVIERAISDLVENQDLVEGTPRILIVGYIVRQLTEAGIVTAP